jgi:hypothetical protein
MAKRAGKAKKKAAPKNDGAWFRRKVAQLKAELDKLPADRQEQLKQDLRGQEKRPDNLDCNIVPLRRAR